MTDRYDTTGNIETQFEPGSNERVLANKLGISDSEVMALQAGLPALDYTRWDENRIEYFAAIQAGLTDYEPMKRMIRQALREKARTPGA